VTITQAIRIVNEGVGTAGVQQGTTGQNAITISAGPNDSVTLRGLNIDGLGSGQNGIVFNSGASLTVSNCVIRHFAFGGSSATGNGILIRPGSGPMSFLISDVTVTDNGYVGVYFTPTGGTPSIHGVIEHVVAVNDQFGFALDSTPATGGAMAVAITNGVASNNSADGLYIAGTAAAPLIISINDSTISGNGNYGLLALNSATVLLSRNMIMSNVNIGIDNAVAPNNFFTYGDNVINGNGTDIAPQALNSSLKLQ
jgi:hypothetical protein